MTRRARPAPIPAEMTTGSYFLALVKRHNWPPGFEAQPVDERSAFGDAKSRGATELRERRAALGIGWGAGTVLMPRTPGNVRPAWMLRPKGEA
jgi:hypothetical protein